ncbi:MAG: DUF3617 domain-containing protein [Sphingomicrobium sp.]|jgi:hypothetical protein
MVRKPTLFLRTGLIGAGMMLVAAMGPSVFGEVQPGVWEISGAPGAKVPLRQCFGDLRALARFEHRNSNCSAKIVHDSASSVVVEYTCDGADFGHSEVDLLTPRSLRISTQGISGGLPFNYVLQARRVDDCPKTASFARH